MGSEQFEKVGAVGRDEIAKMYGCNVLGIWDQRHFLHSSMNAASIAARYDMEDPKMQSLSDSIRANGWLQPGEVWFFDDTKTAHIIFGNCRTFATDYLNQTLLEDEQDPITCRYKVIIKKALTPGVIADALARYTDENNQRKGNDWMTVADTAAHQLRMGVDPGLVLSRWPMIESEAMLKRLTKDDGIRAAHPDLQTALATGQVKLRRALQIADLPLDKQIAAMNGAAVKIKVGGKKPGAVSATKLLKIKNALRDDKRLADVTASDIVAWLCGTGEVNEAGLVIGQILTEKVKPGRKSKETP